MICVIDEQDVPEIFLLDATTGKLSVQALIAQEWNSLRDLAPQAESVQQFEVWQPPLFDCRWIVGMVLECSVLLDSTELRDCIWF